MDIGHSESCTQGNFKSLLKVVVKSPVKLHFLVPYQTVHQTATALRLVLGLQRCSKPWPGCRQSLHSVPLLASYFLLPASYSQLHGVAFHASLDPHLPSLYLCHINTLSDLNRKNICPQKDV